MFLKMQSYLAFFLIFSDLIEEWAKCLNFCLRNLTANAPILALRSHALLTREPEMWSRRSPFVCSHAIWHTVVGTNNDKETAYLAAHFTFGHHARYCAERAAKALIVMKALARASRLKFLWPHNYKATVRPIFNYLAPIWFTQVPSTHMDTLEVIQNEALDH